MTVYTKAAKEISNYLTTGMHHSTKEGQEQMALIIKECFKTETDARRQATFDAPQDPAQSVFPDVRQS